MGVIPILNVGYKDLVILKFIQSRGSFSSFSLGKPRAWTRVWWDKKTHRTLLQSKMGEVRRFGGFPYSFWDHLSKNPNYFLFLLLPSNPLSPGLTPHHICFLSPFSRSPLIVSHLFPPDSNWPSPKAHFSASFTSTALITTTAVTCSDVSDYWELGGWGWTNLLT